MFEYSYKIIMDTQLGSKYGTMLLKIEDNKIEGNMCILANEELIHGEMLGNGMCRLRGRIVTLMRTVEYTAEGYLDDKKIDLILHGERNNFHISGIVSQLEEGGVENEEVL